MSNTAIQKGKKIESLQTLRGIAFLSILSLHTGVFPAGAWGVSVFFILSGFLMAYSYYDKQIDSSFGGCIQFSVKKIKKLYPLHIVTLIIMVPLVLIRLFTSYSLEKAIRLVIYAVLNVFLLQAWIPNSNAYFSYNGVSWYLSVCVLLYALFPIIITPIRKQSNKQLVVTAVVIYMAQVFCALITRFVPILPFSDNFSKWFTYVFPLFRIGDFVIGCCFGIIFLKKDFTYSTVKSTLYEAITIILVLGQIYIYARQVGILGEDWFRFSLLFTSTSVPTVFLFSLNKGHITRMLRCKPLIFLGNISANAFLIHQVVIAYIDYLSKILIENSISKYTKFVLTLFLIVIGNLIYDRVISTIKRKW